MAEPALDTRQLVAVLRSFLASSEGRAAPNIAPPAGIVQPALPNMNLSAQSDPYYGTGHQLRGDVSVPAFGGQIGVSGGYTNDKYDPRFSNSFSATFRKPF